MILFILLSELTQDPHSAEQTSVSLSVCLSVCLQRVCVCVCGVDDELTAKYGYVSSTRGKPNRNDWLQEPPLI